MKKIILFFMLFASVSSVKLYCQDNPMPVENDSLYQAHYNKLKELYVKKLHSETGMNSLKAAHLFKKKLNFRGDSAVLATREGTLQWVSENLARTDFKTYEDAVKAYDEVEATVDAEMLANRDYYDYVIESTKKFGPWIHINAENDVRGSNPEFFTLYQKY